MFISQNLLLFYLRMHQNTSGVCAPPGTTRELCAGPSSWIEGRDMREGRGVDGKGEESEWEKDKKEWEEKV